MAKPTVSMCYCTQCGSPFPILRTNKKIREPGHLKKLWCQKCGETNHIEVRGFGQYTYACFYIEYCFGNFDKNGNRINPNWKDFIQKILSKLNQEAYAKLQSNIENKTLLKFGGLENVE